MNLDNITRSCRFLKLSWSSLALSVLVVAAPAKASKLESWKFDPGQNQLEFSTDEGVQPKAQLVENPTRLVIDLPGVVLGRSAIREAYEGAFRSVRVGQFDQETARLVIELAPGYTIDPNQVKFRGISPQQWIVTLPKPQQSTTVNPSNSSAAPSAVVVQTQSALASALPVAKESTQPAIVEAIELNGGNQLLIRANQPVRYSSRWDRSVGEFRIDIASAQLASHVRGPQLGADSPLQQIRLRQESSQTVSILLRPAIGVQVGQVSQVNQRVLTLQLSRSPRPQAASPRLLSPIITSRSANSSPIPPFQPMQSTSPMLPPTNGRLVVIIDPGHGGPDPGAIGVGGLQEKGIVLDIGTKVATLLQQAGVQVYLTRNDDRDLDLEPRVQMAQQVNATVFVSIHANSISLSRPEVNGLETYYYQSGADLARIIHQSVLQGTGVTDRGVRTARFYVLRKTSMPSVLVEVGFVTGRDDAMRLSNASYRSQMADAIARGILQYLQRAARL